MLQVNKYLMEIPKQSKLEPHQKPSRLIRIWFTTDCHGLSVAADLNATRH